MKILAMFDVDKKKLEETEAGYFRDAFAWCGSDVGIWLEDFQEVGETICLRDVAEAINDGSLK